MKSFAFFITLFLFTCFSFSQTRNLRLVKTPTANPTNQQRKAVVIGMSDYGGNKSLDNTLNDADDMANVLTQLGFEVTLLKNNDLRNLKTHLINWYYTIEGNDVAIFYFAGHGLEVNGQNYLVPLDAELNSQTDVEYNALNVNQVLGNMNEKRVGMKLIILDACRDNPFKRGWRGSEEKGLAGMNAPRGTYIAFAAAPGFTAEDGKNYNLRNGVFTHYLKDEILKAGITIDEIFNNVTGKVSNLTHDQQTPFKSSSLTRNFYFIPPPIILPAPSDDKPSPAPSPVPEPKPVPSPAPTVNIAEVVRQANAFFGKKQYQEALPLYQQAANADDSGAQNKLGNCYANGLGVTKDYTQAVYWFKKAADQASDDAQNSLGTCYENGYGVTKDMNQAIEWYKKAAEQGNIIAQHALDRLQNNPVISAVELLHQADTYYSKNQYSDAFPLYKQAAEQGNADAQNGLGTCYENGYGVPKDKNQAIKWYKKATEQGNIIAQHALDRLQNNPSPTPVNNRFANYTETAYNLNLEMIAVEGGTFTMGCTSEQGNDCDSDEKPAHQVNLSDFYIGKYEITQAQWKALMGSNPSIFKGDSLPVENVSWNDAREFINKLNAQTGKQYRLPTEAEWEFAARGGNKSRGYKYSGSNTVDNVAWYGDNSLNKTQTVGTLSPNEIDIYDMSGNVWEWCNDKYNEYNGNSQTNSQSTFSGSYRMFRGGGCRNYAKNVRVSYRNCGAPGDRNNSIGFRLACSSQ